MRGTPDTTLRWRRNSRRPTQQDWLAGLVRAGVMPGPIPTGGTGTRAVAGWPLASPRVSHVFETPIQPRFRDINPGNHVDSVECIRLLDEARLFFFRWAELPINEPGQLGLFSHRPEGVSEVIASHHINYLDEIRYRGHEPFRVQVWVSRIGGSSFDVSCQLWVAGAEAAALIGISTTVCRDQATGGAWRIDGPFRAALEHYAGEPLPVR